jgi:hypothetical protein
MMDNAKKVNKCNITTTLQSLTILIARDEYGLATFLLRGVTLNNYFEAQSCSWYYEKFCRMPSLPAKLLSCFIRIFCRPQLLHCIEAKWEYYWGLPLKKLILLKD